MRLAMPKNSEKILRLRKKIFNVIFKLLKNLKNWCNNSSLKIILKIFFLNV